MDRRLGKSDRLKRRKDISRVFEQGRSASNRLLRMCVLGNSLGRSRLAVAVPTRLGPAVRRNRVKRLCREAFRACRCELPGGYDYVVIPQVDGEFSVEGIQRSIRELTARLVRQVQR